MADRVFIHGLEVAGIVGCRGWERRIPQRLLVDVEMETDTRPAAASDALADALDYSAVAERVTAVVQASTFRLLEALAERLASEVLAVAPSAEVVLVRVTKSRAVPAAAGVGVEIVRRREAVVR